MTKLIIFDLDGTLLNTIEDISDALNQSLIENNLPSKDINEIKYMVGSGVDILIQRALHSCNIDNNNSLFQSLKESYLKHYNKCKANKTKPYDGIISLLEILKLLFYLINPI